MKPQAIAFTTTTGTDASVSRDAEKIAVSEEICLCVQSRKGVAFGQWGKEIDREVLPSTTSLLHPSTPLLTLLNHLPRLQHRLQNEVAEGSSWLST